MTKPPSKILRADGVGYHQTVPEVIEQTLTISRKIETRPVDEDGKPLPPRVSYEITPSENISPAEIIVSCTFCIDQAISFMQQMERKRAEAIEQAARAKQGLPRLVN